MGFDALELGQVSQGERLENVAQGVVADGHEEHHHQALEVIPEQQRERRDLCLGRAFVELLELRGFRNAATYPKTHPHQHDAADERDAPAAGKQELVAVHGQQVDGQRRQQQPQVQAQCRPGTLAAALAFAGMLIRGDSGPGQFGTRAQALNDPHQHQDDRCPDADRGIAGNQADQGGAHPHHAERDDQHLFAPEAVAQVAEQNAAERTGDEADGEGGEGQQCRHLGVAGIEEDLREHDRRHGGVQIEVIPLQHRAEDGGSSYLAQPLALLFRGFVGGRGRLMYRHR
ncbi:hypothetical protein D3C84_285140 [compost metagenome]